MPADTLFIAQAFIIVVGVIALTAWLHRRLPAMWRSWVWGAIAFVASQVARLPLLFALTIFFQQTQLIPRNADPNFVFWFNLVVLAGTAGLFEESARYIVLRFVAKDVRGWNEAVMFGAGYGGVEATLLIGGTAVSNLFLLANADTLLAQTRALSPVQADQLAAQIETVRNVTWPLIAASLIERSFAIMLQIGLSVMVMRAVEAHKPIWWLAAIAVHSLVDMVALVAQRAFGILGAEVAVAIIGLAMLVFTLLQRPRIQRSSTPATPGHMAQV